MQLSAGAVIVLIYSGEQMDKTAEVVDPDEESETQSKFMQVLPSLVIIFFFNTVPVFFYFIMTHKRFRHRLEEPKIVGTIGTMYATVVPRTKGSLMYNVVFLFRRSTFVLITFTLFEHPGIQIQAFIYSTLLYLIFLHHYPVFKESLTLKVETFNETIFLLICYHMVLFSNLIWDPTMKENIGQSMIGCVFCLLGVNTVVIMTVSCGNIKHKGKLKYLKKIRADKMRQRYEADQTI
jgi:ABC-type sugar transport system permease subunit